ncbi:DUF4214 domain-containing protein [Methylobacterium planeticum]|uniref:DUF4214 domain-containing protein n=1 Tax=Methylobacterium planeticum TaxID=2615211 RepID=UPI001781D73F|nr:DUF4214 domain-containing protein [Methylobacterium planeticum]
MQRGSENSYTPAYDQAGQEITVTARYTDHGGDTSRIKVSAGVVEDVDRPGSLSLAGLTDGNAVEGTPIVATISDPDGDPSRATYIFRADGDVVQRGHLDSYTPGPNQVGQSITVTARYTDGQDHEARLSASAGTAQAESDETPVLPPAPTVVLAHDTGTSPSDGLTSDATLTVGGRVAGGVLQYSLDGHDFAATAPSFAQDGSDDGPHTVSVRQVDPAGEHSPATAISFTLDTLAPKPVITGSNASSHTVSGTLDVTNIADVGITVTLYEGDTPVGSGTVDAGGHWNVSLALSDGASHTLIAKSLDQAGNLGTSGPFVLNANAGGDAGGGDGTPGSGGSGGSGGDGASGPALSNALWFGAYTHYIGSTGGQVYALYEGLLDRAPDPLSEGWHTLLDHGARLSDVTQAILASPEAQAHLNASSNAGFVEQLYQTVLERSGDAAGSQFWMSLLDGGASRAEVADGFVFSSEHFGQLQPAFDAGVFVPDPIVSDVARLYYGLLDRAPDTGGLQGWYAAAHAGAPFAAIAQAILASPEYATLHPTALTNAQYVESLYEGALGRSADPVGAQVWGNALASGTLTRAEVALAVSDSTEANQHLSSVIESGWVLA